MSTIVTQRRRDKHERLAAIEAGERTLPGVETSALYELERELFGYLLVPGDSGYQQATRQEDPAFVRHPFAVAYCEQREDVAVCIRWCRRYGKSATFRSGGHSTAGYAVLDGTLTIDVSQLDAVHVDPVRKIARCEPGVNFAKLNTVLDHYRLHVPGGGCGTVCVAGYMQGGGYGFTSRPFGMNCDNVESVLIYDGHGKLRRLSADENTDVFWAIRGGTGGTFGAVVEITYRLRDLDEIWGFGLEWDLDDAAAAMKAMQDGFMGREHPGIGYMAIVIATKGEPALYMRGVCVDGEDAGRKALKSLIDTARKPIMSKPGRYAELNTLLLEDLAPKGLGSINEVKVSNYIETPVGPDGWKRVIDLYRKRPKVAASEADTLCLEPYGGAIADGSIAGNDTRNAFIHREVLTDFVVDSFYGSSDEKPQAEAWRDAYTDFLRGPNGVSNKHVYQNYPEDGLTDWAEAYFGSAASDLRDVKALIDPPDDRYPNGFFHFPQSIRP